VQLLNKPVGYKKTPPANQKNPAKTGKGKGEKMFNVPHQATPTSAQLENFNMNTLDCLDLLSNDANAGTHNNCTALPEN